jgi:uncharacterized RDD family membrane protein YckC
MQNIPTNLAGTRRRFFTGILDTVCIFILAILFGISGIFTAETDEQSAGFGLLIVLAYYFFQEVIDGKTLGKRILGTKAISKDGREISAGQAFGRTLCRLIPFEAVAYFINGFKPIVWHDSIPSTYVVNVRGRETSNSVPTTSNWLNSAAKPIHQVSVNDKPSVVVTTIDENDSVYGIKPSIAKRATVEKTDLAPIVSKTQAPSNPSVYLSLQAGADDLWENAMAECNSGLRKAGLWARCFAEADGDENKAQARYMKFRVAEEQQRIDDETKVAQSTTHYQAKHDATKTAQVEANSKAKGQKGLCPNCSGSVFLDASECVHCKAWFRGHLPYGPSDFKPENSPQNQFFRK